MHTHCIPVRTAACAALAAAGWLAGCSDSTGDEENGFTITAANAPTMAAEALDLADTYDLTAQALPAIDVAQAAAAARVHAASAGHRTAQGLVEGRWSEDCAGGGSVDGTYQVASRDAASVGDVIGVNYHGCVQDGRTIDGTFGVRLTQVAADLSSFGADLDADIVGTAGPLGWGVRGTIRLFYDATQASSTSLKLAGDTLRLQRLRNGSVRAERTLTDFDLLMRSYDDGHCEARWASRSSGSFPVLGKVNWTVETTQPLVLPPGATQFASGVLVVTGGRGSRLTITVAGDGVDLGVDADGNGSPDGSPEHFSWSEVQASGN